MDPRLLNKLSLVAARYRHRRLVLLLTSSWLLLGILLAIIYFHPPSWTLPPLAMVSAAGIASLFLLAGSWILARRTARDPLYVAGQIENAFPELDALLLTAVDQAPDLRRGQFTFLQLRVIHRSLQHARLNHWREIIPTAQLRIGHALHVMALVGLIGFASLWMIQPPRLPASILGSGIVLQDGTLLDGRYQFEVIPGDTEIERESSLLITARFSGQVPDHVTLLVDDADGNQRELPMIRSLDDPVFGVHLSRIATPIDYHLEIGSQQSEDFHVGVFEFPELRQADATLDFPEYTGMQTRTVEDTRRVTAVEGTSLRWSCQLNKSVSQAWLETESGEKLTLELDDAEKTVYTVNMTLVSSERYRLHLRDDRDRANQDPPELVVNALKNQPPTLKLTAAGDRRVSALEEMDIGASASDDFGLEEFGISYSIGGENPVEIKLGTSIAGNMEQVIDYLIDFESLKAEPDQLLSFHFWVVDFAADGNLRRTFSDIFFAEVRPFEEIFRQGQQPPGGEQQQQQQQGESQNEQQAGELAELQKQIIIATWNILRRETRAEVSGTFADDLRLLMVSQQQVIEQVGELKQALQDDRSRTHADSAIQQMDAVLQQLSRAIEASSAEPLQEALSREQAAYQNLLKLRAREYEVTRQQSQQSSSSQQSSQSSQQQSLQQQLNELELDEDENRYETARTEQLPGETPEQKEQREVLNRLKELAERQGDLNKQIEELKSALEAAEEDQQEELQRQLKRLREQQQEILRDTDELQEQMSESRNRQQMQESRQQLEETRENIREASEALEEGQLSQASASGVRAERELEEMRDDFRRRTANQFKEEVQQLSEAAEQLQEREQDIAQKLKDLDREEPRGLRDTRPREQISEAVKEQEQDLQTLLEAMRDTIERAELAEPLLSRQLYDTLRNTQHDRLEDALRGTRELLDAGFPREAERPEEMARQGIDRLNQGVQQAAESVLGDPVEALRRAEQTLQQAAEDLEQEIDRSQPDRQPPQPGQQPGQPSETPPQPGQQPGQPSETPPQPGQQPGQPSETPPQPGQQSGQPSETPPQPGQQPGQPGEQRSDPTAPRQGIEQLFGPGGEDRAPLTGNDFRQWSDQLRNVEEMLDDPELRSDVARLREQARSIRAEYKRHSKEPNWDLVRENLLQPLVELQQQIHEEILRHQSRDALVPIDRDPVPDKYSEQVKRYYEQLGNERAGGKKKPE
jgi:hypothetical protein